MKKFLLRCFAFFALILLINLSVNIFLEYELKYADYLHQFEQVKSIKPPIILFGDSHAHNLKRRDIHPIYNFARGSDSYADIFCKLSYCIDQKAKPEIIFLQCDMHDFSDYHTHINNAYRTVFFTDKQTFQCAYHQSALNYYLLRYFYPLFPLFEPGNGLLLYHILEGKMTKIFSKKNTSTINSDLTWAQLSSEEREKKSRQRFLFHFSKPFEGTSAEIFNSILELCTKNEIKVIGIRFPLDSIYENMVHNCKLNKTDSVFLSSGIRILNYSDSLRSPAFFYNQDHVNEKGSEWLGKKIRIELEQAKVADSILYEFQNSRP